jgi:hypothetical protein
MCQSRSEARQAAQESYHVRRLWFRTAASIGMCAANGCSRRVEPRPRGPVSYLEVSGPDGVEVLCASCLERFRERGSYRRRGKPLLVWVETKEARPAAE